MRKRRTNVSTQSFEPVFEPRIVAFLCNWCAYGAADLAGVNRLPYPVNVRPVRVMCSAGVSPHFILRALQSGADGVLVGG
jgi:F420-non-reducing hydrogenase iron-sulfur subunit